MENISRRHFIGGGVTLAAALAVPLAHSQFFDVPFVPTPQVVVDEMLRLAGVGPKDIVYDLGSGDGRIVITAVRKFGAQSAVGVELDNHLIYQSEESARQANLENRVKFLQQDFFKTDFSQATVVTLYLLPAVMRRLRETMLRMKPGTRLVAHDFDFDDWKPDRKTTIRKNVFLWIVPAQVGGRWQVRAGVPGGDFVFDMELRQKYQELDGFARIEAQPGGLWEAAIEGDRVRFAVVDSRDRDNEITLYFDGRATPGVMEGEGTRGTGNQQSKFRWRATRLGDLPVKGAAKK